MLLGVIADDFTGASDIANTIAKGVAPEGGLRTVQYLGVPTTDVAPNFYPTVSSFWRLVSLPPMLDQPAGRFQG